MHDNAARGQRAGKAAKTIDKRMGMYNVVGMSMGRNRSRGKLFSQCSLVAISRNPITLRMTI